MSTHRNIDRICIVVLMLTLLLTVAFMNGETLGIRVVADEDAESYSGSTYFTENDLDGDWTDNAYTTYITLDGSEGTIDGNGAYFLNGDLVISNGGWYVLSGSLEEGSIIVDASDSSKIWIRLNGVTVNCTDDACLRIDQADKVFLTLAEGTENTFVSGDSYSENALSDNTGGTIFSHDDLTINGSGNLTVNASYKHGIDVNDSLVITGGTITITAVEDGIHVNDSFRFTGASLTIDTGDDAVHSDDELYVESGTILIQSCNEGLEAATIDITGGDVTIYPVDDGLNASSGSSATGFGGGMGGGAFPGGNEEFDGEMPSKSEEMPSTSEEMPQRPSGDPPQMSGETEEAATDNSSDQEEAYIRISGGTITIINENGRDADGLDSNGSIYIDGGTILISLPGDGGNNALDFGSENGGECIVTGGTILAFGDSSMAEEFSSQCTQCAVLYNLDSSIEAGTLFKVMNSAGEDLLSYTPQCNFSSAAFSSPALTVGETYTILYGESSAELTIDSTAMSVGSSGSAGGMQPNGADGIQPEDAESNGEETPFERTDRPSGGPKGQWNDVSPDMEPVSSAAQTVSNGTALNELSNTVWLLLGASFLVLAAGIIIAKCYRKH